MAARHYIRKAASIGLLLLVGAVLQPVRAQTPPPPFGVDAVSMRGNGVSTLSRVDLYARVPYNLVKFLNTANGFTARYDVTVEVAEADAQGRRRNVVMSRLWEGKIVVNTYAATQGNAASDLTTHAVDLAPGRYLLSFQVEDKQSNQSYVRELPLEVRNLNKPVAVSDVVFIEDYNERNKTITPRVSDHIGTDENLLRMFYEVYSERPRTVRLSYEMVRAAGGAATRTEASPEVIYTRSEEGSIPSGRKAQFVVSVPLSELKAGPYTMRVKVQDERGTVLDMAEKTLQATWTGLADHIRDLDQAIAQLQYIAKSRELQYIREGSSLSERTSRFLTFWKRRDPTPTTDRNERMEEYYYRISFANRRYGTPRDGWKTDRGYVVVSFGEPDFVERHPYSFGTKPYEVWYYYRLGKRFVFIDETGLGDYKLLRPVWDERNRIR
jgi:GWxTD domain-containing protein